MLPRSAAAAITCCAERLIPRGALAWSSCNYSSSARAVPPGACEQEFPSSRPDLSPLLHHDSVRRRLIDAALRVDHAGETAAVRIYEGQAAVLGSTEEGPTLASMAAHERAHLERFQHMVRSMFWLQGQRTDERCGAPQLPVYRARPSALLPVWSSAAFALGACSALLGRETAYAVTEAVEEVITAHYNDQLRDLAEHGLADEVALRRVFRSFRDDEQEHLEEAVRRDAHKAPGYLVLFNVVKTGCSAAIWLAKRI